MNRRSISLFTLIAVATFCTQLFAQAPVRVPKSTHPVMIDGKIAPGEWDDAATVPLGDFARVYIKQTPEHLWLALELLQNESGTLDLFVAPGDARLVTMHASAKLGQRLLQKDSWPEEWTWWNNQNWVANVSRVDSWDKRTFMPEKVREFQISRTWFPSKDFRLMFESMTPAQPSWKTTSFPAGASNTDPKNWIAFRFD